MSIRIYVVTFAIQSSNLYNFEYFLKYSHLVNGYWNYVPLTYCFKTYLDANTILNHIKEFFPGGNFFIAEINPGNMTGSLPQQAWEWFYAPPENRASLVGLGQLPPFPSLG